MGRIPLTVVVAGLLSVAPVAASALPSNTRESAQDQELARCIDHSARGKPWLARTLWGLRDQEGGWVGVAVRNNNGTDDLGAFQINSSWAGRIAVLLGRKQAEIRWWLQHDTCFNVDAARWIFLSALSVSGDYWEAIGAYHSPTAWRRDRYARDVAVRLVRRFGPNVFRPKSIEAVPRNVRVTSQEKPGS